MAEPAQFEQWRARIFEAAPYVAGAAAFAAGALTLIAIATPALPHLRGLDVAERLIAEMPELTASLAGVVLMGLATGLTRRIDAAWAATTALMISVCLYASLRHGDMVAAGAAGVTALALLPLRRAFYRHSRLADLMPDRRVALGIAAAFGVAFVGALLWVGERPSWAEAPWWALFTDEHLGRPGRALFFGFAAAVIVIAQRYVLTHPRGAPAPPEREDFARADALIAGAEDALPDAQLAFTGDKSFIFADDAFVMAARAGGSLIAMGPPTGKHAAWRDALRALRVEAERLALRPVVYSAPPSLLPELLEFGFRVEKVGENAIIELAGFSLTGSGRQKLRSARRKFVEREGAVFEVALPPHSVTHWDELAAVSQKWLDAHGGKEKGFSLGAYDQEYLARGPIALVRLQGKVIAFANIWRTADGQRGALDLMRFDPEAAPSGLMDFLFTEILLWAQSQGMRTFDLGMAPLAGLAEEKYASLFARIGRLVHERGEQFYGFQGLRAFKDKFGPTWEPRYIAAPGAWNMPIVLAEVAMLTSRGAEKAA